MGLVHSLLVAISRLDGDALVMHVGEKPFVVTSGAAAGPYRGPIAWGQVELSSRSLTYEAVTGMLDQLLPADQVALLNDVGVIEHRLASSPVDGDGFTVVAARGGDDLWIEVRRRRQRPIIAAEVARSTGHAMADVGGPGPPPESFEPAVQREEPAAIGGADAVQPPSEASALHDAFYGRTPPAVEEQPLVHQPVGIEQVVAADPTVAVEQPAEDDQPPFRTQLIDPEERPFDLEEQPFNTAQHPLREPLVESIGSAGANHPSAAPILERREALLDEVAEPVRTTPASVAARDADGGSLPPVESPAIAEEMPVFAQWQAGAETAVQHSAEPDTSAGAEAAPGGQAAPESAPASRPEERVLMTLNDTDESPADVPVDTETPSAAAREEPLLLAPELPAPEPDAGTVEPSGAALALLTGGAASAPGPPAGGSADMSYPAPGARTAVDGRHIAEPVEDATPPAPREQRPAVVLPLSRSSIRADAPVPTFIPTATSRLDHLLRLAAARAASTLYVVTQSRPAIRVDGEVRMLESEPMLAAAEVETLLMEIAPEPQRDALRTGMVTEWICDVPEVGRIRCMSFRDHRGPGGLFRMLPARAISAEQLGLSREIEALCAQPDGLVLMAGPRASGKSTLMAAFVDLINRTRSDHVITLERQITFVHESRRSFVSQREVRGSAAELLEAARGALREDPDVLVLQELWAAPVSALALEAAEAGRLVIAAVPAPTTTAALERIVDQFPAGQRPQIQTMLAGSLRGVVAQILLRKIGGGRVAAREILLNVPAVAALIAEGKLFQLPLAIDGGRRHGMVPFNDALAAFVRNGAIDPAEAYRRAFDRDGLLLLLRRAGIDTSFVERLA